jgi:hypothetical protein
VLCFREGARLETVIPEFEEASGNLPPGIHEASWDEIVERYGHNATRRKQLAGLRLALDELASAGCSTVYLDGSFVTAKEKPGDFDACWEADGVNADDLHPSLLKLRPPRTAQKRRYQGELVIADGLSEPFGSVFVESFQRDPETGEAKGIIRIDVKEPR